MELIVGLLAMLVFDLAAWRWGIDSTDSVDSRERARRAWGNSVGRGI